MKYIRQFFFSVIILSSSVSVNAQSGSYKILEVEGAGSEYMYSGAVLISKNWISFAFYTPESFLGTMGGTLKNIENDFFTLSYEYSSREKELVGKEHDLTMVKLGGREYTLEVGGRVFVLQPLTSSKNPMSGVWRISGRERNGEMREMNWGSRKTLKFLIGGMFQWVAFDNESGSFSGTGGGVYDAKKGTYKETIQFFSRDQSRVGAQLSFNYELNGDEWTHSGLSSKGDPIKEIWKRIDEE